MNATDLESMIDEKAKDMAYETIAGPKFWECELEMDVPGAANFSAPACDVPLTLSVLMRHIEGARKELLALTDSMPQTRPFMQAIVSTLSVIEKDALATAKEDARKELYLNTVHKGEFE